MDVEKLIERLAVSAFSANAALAKLQAERDEALRQMAVYAREAGLATGKLETSEAAGIVEGWKERAEKAEAERDEAREVLRPFKAAFEYGVTELPDDIQAIQLMRSRVGFKHFRAASRALGGGE